MPIDSEKNYYGVLGVLSNAEDIVIRAAYRALAQRYHPDRFEGSNETDSCRMAEINEAYSILSDPIKRKEYDIMRRAKSGAEEDYYDDTDQDESINGLDSFEADWIVACSVYPDLNQIVSAQKKISSRLAKTYRIYMLESKLFVKRKEIATGMEDHFLSDYFGDNQKIKAFAKELISQGRRNAALALNKLIKIVGDNDPDALLFKIKHDYLVVCSNCGSELAKGEINLCYPCSKKS
jgi:DnaJ-class molecular chaperone